MHFGAETVPTFGQSSRCVARLANDF
jgi:hypothetical protein